MLISFHDITGEDKGQNHDNLSLTGRTPLNKHIVTAVGEKEEYEI